MAITKNDDDSSSHNSEYCSHCQQEFSSLQVSMGDTFPPFYYFLPQKKSIICSRSVIVIWARVWKKIKWKILSTFICRFDLKALKEHIMQVHQSLAAETASTALNGVAQHFSPPPTFSPGNFPFPLVTGANDNRSNSQSRSPNNKSRAYACSYSQCGASFPTGELLDKHEILQHSSGATSVVSCLSIFSFSICKCTWWNIGNNNNFMYMHESERNKLVSHGRRNPCHHL